MTNVVRKTFFLDINFLFIKLFEGLFEYSFFSRNIQKSISPPCILVGRIPPPSDPLCQVTKQMQTFFPDFFIFFVDIYLISFSKHDGFNFLRTRDQGGGGELYVYVCGQNQKLLSLIKFPQF